MTEPDHRHAYDRQASRRDVMIGTVREASVLVTLPGTTITAGANAALKVYPGAPRGLTATHTEKFNDDLPAFAKDAS